MALLPSPGEEAMTVPDGQINERCKGERRKWPKNQDAPQVGMINPSEEAAISSSTQLHSEGRDKDGWTWMGRPEKPHAAIIDQG
jgi:hypothetical protein